MCQTPAWAEIQTCDGVLSVQPLLTTVGRSNRLKQPSCLFFGRSFFLRDFSGLQFFDRLHRVFKRFFRRTGFGCFEDTEFFILRLRLGDSARPPKPCGR